MLRNQVKCIVGMTGRKQNTVPNGWMVHDQIFHPWQYCLPWWNSDLKSQKDDQEKIVMATYWTQLATSIC
jgi:hypothetical protein